MDSVSETSITRSAMTSPKAAAIAGIIFSLLMITSLILIAISVPSQPERAGGWLAHGAETVKLALNLVPFAGIAFLWFIGVVRDRLGQREDKLFATVFLGSGLLFLVMMFISSALAGSLILMYGSDPATFIGSPVYAWGRLNTYHVTQVYTMRMAGLFMISTSTIALRTGILPRWISFLGYACALTLLVGGGFGSGILLVFPGWIFLVSVLILRSNLARH